jgi:pimeloyl-ACP methyl ester carboxylesterase
MGSGVGPAGGLADAMGVVRCDDGVVLATCTRGSGTPFVWAHCLLGSMALEDDLGIFDWSHVTDRVRLVRYDARGHGGSYATFKPDDYSWPTLGRDMLAVADAVGSDPAILGGASMGCATVLHAACSAPERVKALVLVIPPTAWEKRARQARVYRAVARIFETTGKLPFRLLDRLPRPPGSSLSLRAIQRSVIGNLASADPSITAAVLRGAGMSDLPPPERLRSLAMPALILAWPGDPAHPVSTAERLHERLRASSLHVSVRPEQPAHWPDLVAEFTSSL